MKPQSTKAKPAFHSHSGQTGSDYTIYVDAPKEAMGPVDCVLLMDGDFFFDPAVRVARQLQESGRIGPTVVVGVGYGAGFGEPGNHRGRDYTPTASADEPSSGGAGPFLGYLQHTLWPELASRYKVREDRRTLAGHSLGSLLVLYAAFQPRPFFNSALASSPSVWWDNRSLLGLVSDLRNRTASLDASLYLSVGEDDSPSMTGDLALLERQLADRPFKGLKVLSERFEGRDHYDVLPFSLSDGLARLLG